MSILTNAHRFFEAHSAASKSRSSSKKALDDGSYPGILNLSLLFCRLTEGKLDDNFHPRFVLGRP